MNRGPQTTVASLFFVFLMSAVSVAGQNNNTQPAAVTLQATGTFARGGEFSGTVTINRFEQRGTGIVAVGMVRGTLTRGGQTLGSVLAGEISLPVTVSSGGLSPVSGPAAAPQVMRVALSMPPQGGIRRVQATTCTVLDIAVGPTDVNLLGVLVSLSATTINLQGESGTALGALVCEALALITNVAGLVGVLNNLLSLVTGLLGGLTGGLGGIGGIVPGAVPGVG